jgi:hypothetical protein
MGDTPILTGLVDNLKWIPLLVIFLGGNSLHVSQAILSHFFGVDMQWQATAKEVENVTFFEEVPRVIKRFKWTFVWVAMCTGTMLACAYALPDMWRIRFFTPIWPLGTGIVCHALLPVVLNPNLMLFTW